MVRVPMTAEEFFELGDAGPSELVGGQLVMISPAGARHGRVAAKVLFLLLSHVGPRRLGEVCAAETGFLIGRNPDTVRAPDVAFVSADRVPAGGPPESFWPCAPDLAVEVVSPGDRWVEVQEKVQVWLAAGTRIVWVVDPRSRMVYVSQMAKDHESVSVVQLVGAQTLDAGAVIAGFSVTVNEIFD